MQFVISLMRYVAPIAAIFILSTCIISLFRNRPRIHTLARLVDVNDGTIFNITHWETSIGKAKPNDIVLPIEHVSRFHAVIAKRRKEWVVFDTSTRTLGVQVNGESIDYRETVKSGDIISIGTIEFRFECDEAMKPAPMQTNQPQKREKAPEVAFGVLVDINTKRPTYIKKQDVLIGRGSDCDIVIKSQAVSSHHARIHKTSKGWALSDLDSHNGTKLNGKFIDKPQLIFDEDMLTFGDKVCIFYEK